MMVGENIRRRLMSPMLALIMVVAAFLGGLAGAPLVARAVSTMFGVNAQDYGAACNGSDVTTKIQNALNAPPAAGGRVFLPRCLATDSQTTYKITNTLTEPANVILEGETPNAGQIWLSSSSAIPAIKIGSTTASSPVDTHGGGLRNLGIQGNGLSVSGQVGVLVSRALEAKLDNILVQNVETAYKLDGGPSGLWTASTTLAHPMSSNVKYGLYITASGGVVTDTRCCAGGYLWGSSGRSGEGIHADAMESTTFTQFSVESFNYGAKISGTSDYDAFFGGRFEASGPGNGTTAIVCDGVTGYVQHTLGGAAGPKFYSTGDMDVVNTTITNQNGATCVLA